MRLPAVALAAAFGCGAALGGSPWLVHRAASRFWIGVEFFAVAVLIGAGVVLLKKGRLFPAATASLCAWLLLGVLGAGIASQPRAANHVLSLIDSGRLELKTPLRWHGRLRDEPSRLPWGFGYELELTGVEYQGSLSRAHGGLRVSFSPPPGNIAGPDVHAGDDVIVTTQARLPQVYRDDGAFDRRAYLEQQGIDLVATLRAGELMQRVGSARTTTAALVARARHRLREELDELFSGNPETAGVLRAMLLGDRSFVDRAEAVEFQKTGVFHVLVVAGLHVGSIAFFLFWIGRKLRLASAWTALSTLMLLLAYVGVVEQRPPVLRAAVMTAIVVLGGLFFRRLDLLNSTGIAVLLLLMANPRAVWDASFQLTFLAIGCIAGLAAPWLEKTVQPYAKALRTWRDVTRDAAYEPRAIQFRIDLRSAAKWASTRLPASLGDASGSAIAGSIALAFRIWELLVLTLVLQLGMLPLMARDFHRVTLSAPLVNLLAVPLTGVIVPLGFFTLGSGWLQPVLGKLLAAPLSWATVLLVRAVEWFAHFPSWSYRIPGPPTWLIALFLCIGLFLAVVLRVSDQRSAWVPRAALTALILTALVIATCPFAPQWSAGKLEVTVLDVGQGDSIFVVSPQGHTMLIDGGGSFGGFPGQEQQGGPDPGEDAVSPYLWSRGFQKLDVVALTHAHQDHIGGLAAVLGNFHVSTVWIGREETSAALANLEELCRMEKIAIVHEKRGSSFFWDRVQTEILWPPGEASEPSASPKNDDSLVLRLKYGARAFLLPGDAEKPAERSMLQEAPKGALRADVLKVGHHGSKNSTIPDFLAAVAPQVAIISAGEENPYGHPNAELLERLTTAGVRILRTDHHGAVRIVTDGKTLGISCFVACPESRTQAASATTQPEN